MTAEDASGAQAERLYGIAVEMADRVSARRGQANQFYLTLQTLLLGAPALVQVVGNGQQIDSLRSFLLAFVGALVSVTWWLQLRSYRDLNKAKFSVINQIEAEHFLIKPFADEWVSLKTDPVKGLRGRYAELGAVERFVPLVFLVLNISLAIVVWL